MTRYLFRLDMARDNDEFLELRRARQVDHAYSGTPMKVGPGWIPDFVEVSVDSASGTGRLTLIELEATEIAARASCRKYLPEKSAAVLQSFLKYLNTVISQCRATADPRLEPFEKLKSVFLSSSAISVHTGGALRTSADYVEDHPLIDQPERPTLPVAEPTKPLSSFSFHGERRLTRAESDAVRRAIKCLHAVVVGRDHSGGTVKSWFNQKPLERAVSKDKKQYPRLHEFLTSKTDFGLFAKCGEIAVELANLWRTAGTSRMSPQGVAAVIDYFAPVAASFAKHEPMQTVFEQAREAIHATVSNDNAS